MGIVCIAGNAPNTGATRSEPDHARPQSNAADTAVGAPTGYAVAMGGGNILQARRNSIHDNDNGVYIGGTLASGFDFSNGGQSADANKFYCNSKGVGNGYDLLLAFTTNTAATSAATRGIMLRRRRASRSRRARTERTS